MYESRYPELKMPLAMPCTGASARSTVPSDRVWISLPQSPPRPLIWFRIVLRPPVMPSVSVDPLELVTETLSGMLNMSTVVLLMKMPSPLLLARANSVQS